MITQEFKQAVLERKLLRTRIMLKDALILDVTFKQFDEMVDYAALRITNLFETHDDGYLEEDVSKWDDNLMNNCLVELIGNFSKLRVNHLKKLIFHLYGNKTNSRNEEIKKSKENNNVEKFKQFKHLDNASIVNNNSVKETNRIIALRKLKSKYILLKNVVNEINEFGWTEERMDKIVKSASGVINSIEVYKKNK